MNAVYALYSTPQSAARALDALKARGITEAEITVLSSEPFEEYSFGKQGRGPGMPWIAVAGGVAGLTAALFMTSFTQQDWPINTGGMPIGTSWANFIVLFELTMLGAVLATTVSLLITARLPGKLPGLYDPEISQGKILVGVERPKNASAVEEALHEAGDGEVKTRISRIP